MMESVFKFTFPKFASLLIGLLLLIFTFSNRVLAGEITISGNGDNSVNSASADITSSSNVVQNNQAEINNNVEASANTGNNSANANNAESTSIDTGDVTTSTSIENRANSSQVQSGCCRDNDQTDINISGNASNSESSANLSIGSTTNILVNQNATITNTINGYAATGSNNANNNNGDVSISTGNIIAKETIKNTNVNITDVIALNANINLIAKIVNNAANSRSQINADLNNDLNIVINNNSHINNLSFWKLITGENSANGNNGNVSITTGDILFISSIVNEVNKSKVDVDCGCREEEEPGDGQDGNDGEDNKDDNGDDNGDNGTPPSNNTSNPSSGGGSSGEVLGAVLGNLLPDTGSNWLLLMTILSGILFALGWYLRLHPGCAPNPA